MTSRVVQTVKASIEALRPLQKIHVSYRPQRNKVVLRSGRTELHMKLTQEVTQDLWEAHGDPQKVRDHLWAGRIQRAVGELMLRAGCYVAQETVEPFVLPAYLQRKG